MISLSLLFGARPRCGQVPEGIVQQDGDQEHDADDEKRQVPINIGEADGLGNDGKRQHTEHDAHDGSEPAGEQHSANDDRDDRVEDQPEICLRRCRTEGHHLQDTGERS